MKARSGEVKGTSVGDAQGSGLPRPERQPAGRRGVHAETPAARPAHGQPGARRAAAVQRGRARRAGPGRDLLLGVRHRGDPDRAAQGRPGHHRVHADPPADRGGPVRAWRWWCCPTARSSWSTPGPADRTWSPGTTSGPGWPRSPRSRCSSTTWSRWRCRWPRAPPRWPPPFPSSATPTLITVISIAIVILMCYGNLRGIREASRAFARAHLPVLRRRHPDDHHRPGPGDLRRPAALPLSAARAVHRPPFL